MQSKFAKASAVVGLLLNSASAITDHPDGLGGPAPCLDSYAVVKAADAVGGDPHLCHGLAANGGGHVGVGSSKTKGEDFGSGDGFRGLIVRTNANCNYDTTDNILDRYPVLDGAGSACTNYKWATKLGGTGLNARANWVAASSDNSFYIAVGVEQESTSVQGSRMAIWKVNAADGTLVWKMNYGTAGTVTGLESVAFLSNGDLVVGGFTDSEGEMKDQYFKSGGQITMGKPFIAKIAASDVNGSTAPSAVAWSYSLDAADYTGSTKSLQVDGSDKIYAVVGAKSAAVKLNADGTEVWKTGLINANAQMNDLTVNSDGTIAMTGHEYGKQETDCWFEGCGTIKGKVIKLDASGNV